MLLNGFEDKTGNVISITFFSLLLFLLLLAVLFSKKISKGSIGFLLLTSVLGLISLAVSDFIFQKETKIIFISVFLVTNIFLFSSLLVIVFSGSKNFRFFKSLLVFFVILILAVSVVFIKILNFKDDYVKYEDGKSKANSGVILGAAVWGGNRPSPVLKERINKGYEIYQRKIVPKLVITGGGSPNELTEGEVSKNVLIKYGVEPENLILENSSSSTVEQIRFVKDSLYNVKNWEKIILISDNFHLYRSSEICKFNDMNADCIASDKELSSAGTTFSFCLKESLALIVFWMAGT